MGITVNGPHSGLPVKVRDQDVGRAVKDEQGRIFYVLPKSDGSGYYGAMTRAGGTKDEARALEMENKSAMMKGNSKEEQQQAFHDARGKGRGGLGGKLVVLVVIVVVLAAAGWAVTMGPLKGMLGGGSGSSTPAPAAAPNP